MAKQRPLSERLSKLPPGRHLIPSDFVSQNQRERMLLATAELVAERGYQKTTIELIAKTSRVALVTFYEHFSGKEECFVAAFDRAVGGLRAAIPAELLGPEQAPQALAALLAALDADPQRARLCFVEAQKGGPLLRARYEAALDAVAGELSDSLGQAIVGGLAWLLRERLELGGGEGVQGLLPRMTEIVLDPYLVHG
jgi:AcrR family transcriptional regulator